MSTRSNVLVKEQKANVILKGEVTNQESKTFLSLPDQRFRFYGPLLLLTALSLVARLLTLPNFIESRDGLFFVSGLKHYSVVETSPHWPGYPVYIWIGRLFHLFIADPVQALHLLALIASTLTIWPIAVLAYSWRKGLDGNSKEAGLAGFAAGTIWALVPLSWLGGSEIFSDPLALFLGLIMLWLSWRSLKAGEATLRLLIIAAVVGGLMLGVRLSYVTLLLPLVYATWKNRKFKGFDEQRAFPILPILVLISFGFTLGGWVSWQWLMDGSGFISAGIDHLTGHYEIWGGSVTTDHNLLTRPARFLQTGLVYGLGGWWPGTPLLRLPATAALLFPLALGVRRLRRSSNQEPLLLSLLWAGPYLLWILLGNDVDLARYYFPVVALGCILVGIGLPQFKRSSLSFLVLGLAVIALAVVVVPLALEHPQNLPVAQKLTSYVKANLDPALAVVIISDDVPTLGLFMQKNIPNFETIRVRPEEMAKRVENLKWRERLIYGTWLPHSAPPGWVPIARLCRGQFMESRGPLEIWLYQYNPSRLTSQESSPGTDPGKISLQCY